MSPGSCGQSITRSRLRHSAQLVQLPTRHCIGASGVDMGLPGSVRRPAVSSVRLCAASLCQSYLELMLLHTLTGSSFLQSCASLLSSTWWPFWFLFWDLICVEGLMISEDCDDSWHTGRYHSWHSWQLKLWSCYCQVSSEQSGVN